MANFIVTFRLQAGPGYQGRYDSIMEKMSELVPEGTWEETSSFVAFSSNKTLDDVHCALYLESDFDPTKDTMVVIDLLNRKKKTAGIIESPHALDKCLGF
ncbi:hypothetical protein ACIPIN_01965 [Pseudomonas sp. NPDC087697]|uniref:hypothetical protein n=1 Tax=Pseudomonas sp. NPDC087697 TaxID=3364447 RepID=UPI0037F7174A